MWNNIKKFIFKKFGSQHYKQGFSTLYIVIILGSVSLGLVLMMTTSSFWSVKSGIIVKNDSQSKALANACAEVALEIIRESNNFVGVGNVTINTSNCIYNVINTGGLNRSIEITSIVSDTHNRLLITTNSFNPIEISSWQEVE